MTVLFVNNFTAVSINGSVGTSDTIVPLQSADVAKLDATACNIEGNYYVATMNNGSAIEIIHITGITGNNLVVTRAQEGTSALSYVSGDIIECRNTKGMYEQFLQDADMLDEDDMASDSNTKTATQQSIKAYVDAAAGGATGVQGPVSTTENNIPQWDSTNRVLKDGKAAPTGDIVGTTDTQTLSGKTLSNPKINEAVNMTATSTNLNYCKPASLPNSYLVNMSEARIKGRASGAGTGSPSDLTAAQVLTILGVESGATADQTASEIRDLLHTLSGTDRLNADYVRDALQNIVEDTTPQLGGNLDGQDYQASAIDFKDISEKWYDNGTVSSGTATIDYRNGGFQRLKVGGDISIAFTNWPASGKTGVITLMLIGGKDHTVSWPDNETIVSADTSISASTTDDSFNDSGSNFGTSIVEDDHIEVSGFTESANNGTFLADDDSTTSKIKVKANLVTEAAGDAVTIERKVLVTDGGEAPDLSGGDVSILTLWSHDAGHNIYCHMSGENMG